MKTVPMRAEADDHEVRLALPVGEYGGTGVWIDCATCDDYHWVTPEETTV